MEKTFTVQLNPLRFYHRYRNDDYYLFGLEFRITSDGDEVVFRSQCSDSDIKDIIHEIDLLEAGEAYTGNLYFPIPWIVGGFIVYPFSFFAQADSNGDVFWTFRYKKNQNDKDFDYQIDLTRQQLLQFRDSLKGQYDSFDFSEYGKTTYFTFAFPEKGFEWCYSASSLESALNSLCGGNKIEGIYVSAQNYSDPLKAKLNFVNYYLGAELIIRTDSFLLDLLIHAGGLVEFRWFKNDEYVQSEPIRDFIEDGNQNYCDISEMFDLKYHGASIEKAFVDTTKYWPWKARGFDESKLTDPIELPKTISFDLDNGNRFSTSGWDDDFIVTMEETEEQTK